MGMKAAFGKDATDPKNQTFQKGQDNAKPPGTSPAPG
jgi:hypothetical protein